MAIAGALSVVLATPASAATTEEIGALRLLPCPAYETLDAGSSSPRARESALGGEFAMTPGQPATLAVPVDWRQDPYFNRTWVFRLHSLYWVTALLDAYADGGDKIALVTARDLALDWIAQVAPGDEAYGPLAWEAKSAGDRGGRLAYLARALACENLVTDAQAAALIDSLREHGEYLADDEHYVDNNHGLYADYGLALIAHQLPFLSEAPGWAELAQARYEQQLDEELSSDGSLFLEHSPQYQVLIADLTAAMVRIGGGPALAAVVPRMREAAGWFVMPNRTRVPLGDTAPSSVAAGSWLGDSGAATRGFFADLDSGLGIVKRGGGYLALTSWYHRGAHRHADDLSFHLQHRGRDVISDSGFYSYDFERWRVFSRTARAHSGLTIGRHGFPIDREHAYGSGLLAAGRGAGWFALLATNPLARRYGVRHIRLLLYRPGAGVVVVDRLRSSRRHRYVRRFQVAPGIRAREIPVGWRFRGPGLRGQLTVGRRSARAAVKGEGDPVGGWYFPGYREKTGRWTLIARDRAADADLVAGLGVRRRLTARIVGRRRSGLVLAIERAGKRRVRLAVARRGDTLHVSRRR